MKDPFDNADEAQIEDPAPPSEGTGAQVARLAAAVEANPNGEHVVTLKGGSGYDAPWYVIHASGLAELEELFGDGASRLAALFERIQQAGKHFVKVGGGAPAPARAASAPPQGATEAPAWAGEAPVGYKYATGVKNGRTWHAWFPIERDGGEKIWLNAPKGS